MKTRFNGKSMIYVICIAICILGFQNSHAADVIIPCGSEPTDMNIDLGDIVECQIDPAGDSDRADRQPLDRRAPARCADRGAGGGRGPAGSGRGLSAGSGDGRRRRWRHQVGRHDRGMVGVAGSPAHGRVRLARGITDRDRPPRDRTGLATDHAPLRGIPRPGRGRRDRGGAGHLELVHVALTGLAEP